MNLKERARLVDSLGSAIEDGELSLGQVPQILRKVLKEDAWQEFETKMGKRVTYDRFEDFVEKPPLEGLGTTVETLRDIIANDPELIIEVNKRVRVPLGTNQHTEGFDNVKTLPSTGNSAIYALQRLGDANRTDLLERVKSGEISPHRAMIEAGFRRPTISIDPSSPQAARTLIEKASPEFLAELRRLLNN
jgi:hypothetical protein